MYFSFTDYEENCTSDLLSFICSSSANLICSSKLLQPVCFPTYNDQMLTLKFNNIHRIVEKLWD